VKKILSKFLIILFDNWDQHLVGSAVSFLKRYQYGVRVHFCNFWFLAFFRKLYLIIGIYAHMQLQHMIRSTALNFTFKWSHTVKVICWYAFRILRKLKAIAANAKSWLKRPETWCSLNSAVICLAQSVILNFTLACMYVCCVTEAVCRNHTTEKASSAEIEYHVQESLIHQTVLTKKMILANSYSTDERRWYKGHSDLWWYNSTGSCSADVGYKSKRGSETWWHIG